MSSDNVRFAVEIFIKGYWKSLDPVIDQREEQVCYVEESAKAFTSFSILFLIGIDLM